MWRLNDRREAEPYCNNEVTIELGYSFINHLVKGRDVGMSNFGTGGRKRPFIAYITTPYPNIRDKTRCKYPCLGIVESMKYDDYFPVPIEYFERIQQEDFWNHHVQVFGTGSVHMGPLVHGRRVRSSTLPEVPPINDQQIFIGDDLGEGEVAAVEIENRKRLNAGWSGKLWRQLLQPSGPMMKNSSITFDRAVEQAARLRQWRPVLTSTL
jgi:hypothetical protein